MSENVRVCFVLMPFSEPFNEYYQEIIRPAVEETGLVPHRADEVYGVRPVIYDIWEGIQAATIVISEVTGRNANVLYELGIAHGIGKLAVILTQSMEDVPFDLRHLRYIQYNTLDKDWAGRLRTKLTNTIRTILENPDAQRLSLPYVATTANPHSTAQPTAGKSSPPSKAGKPSPPSKESKAREYWNKYKEIARQIKSHAERREYQKISDQLVTALDEPVQIVSSQLMNILGPNEKLFYGLPLSVTASRTGSQKSKEWSKQHTTDHWVVSSKDSVFIAWRQEAAYFFYIYDAGRKHSDGLTPTIEKGDRLLQNSGNDI